MLTATQADKGMSADERARAKDRWLRQFNTAFGNDENGEATTFNGSIPQALTLMNGDLVKRATGSERGGLLYRVANDSGMPGPKKVQTLYLAALARRPERGELRVCNQLLAARRGSTTEALQDIWWALLNSNEFILNH